MDKNSPTYVLMSARLVTTNSKHLWGHAVSLPKLRANLGDVCYVCQIYLSNVQDKRYQVRAVGYLELSVYAVLQAYCNLSTLNVKWIPILSSAELSKPQQEDTAICEIWSDLNSGHLTQVDQTNQQPCPLFLRE